MDPKDAAVRSAFEALIESIPQGVFYKASDGSYVACNSAFAELTGAGVSEIIGSSDFDIFPKRVADKLLRWMAELSAAGAGGGNLEFKLAGSGTFTLRGAALRDASGELAGFVGTVLDVTEERRDASERSNAKIMAAAAEMAIQTIEGMIDPVIILDGQGRIERVNRGYAELFGLDDGAVGHSFSRIFVDMDEAAAASLLGRCRELGRMRDLELRVRDAGGRTLPVLVNLSLLRDSQRAVDGWVLAVKDVSSLVDANARLQENERAMEAILNASEDAVFLVDGEDVIKSANRALAERFGMETEDLVGLRLDELPDRDIHEVRGHFVSQIRRDGRPGRVEYERGKKIFHNTGYPIFDADGSVRDIAIYSYDVTDRRQGERLQRALYSISEAAYFARDTRNLFALVHRIVARLTQADHLAIVLHDARTGALECPYNAEDSGSPRYSLQGAPQGAPQGGCEDLGYGLVRLLVDEGKTLLLDETRLRRLRSEGVDIGDGPLPREWLGVPLRNGESEIIGALVSRSRRSGSSFSDEDRRVLNFVSSQIAMAIERKRNEEELREKNALLKSMTDGTILALVKAVELRDPYTAGHQQRVSKLSYAMARELGLSDERREATRVAALLHDVGKISVPSELLSKPGRLTDLELQLIRQHPLISEDILRSIDFPYPVARYVREHHEKWDGSGYPDGLSGEGICLESRIICVADVADAMASHRPYRPSLGLAQALEELARSSGVLYDPDVVAACRSACAREEFDFGAAPDRFALA